MRTFTALLAACALATPMLRAADPAGDNHPLPSRGRSVVRINTTALVPDYKTPWLPGRTTSGNGAGFVIDGNRILTNAHVVSNSRFLTVERERDPRQYVARVLYVAHDADLAVLELEDATFFEKATPLQLGGIPAIESTVSVYGYPIGGDRLSVTRGIVSRIDYQVYSHSAVDAHLAIQIDAAINPGNSGGPVLQDGKVVGVAFQGYAGDVAQNTGYMIPTPVVRRFLQDIEDGKYDRYVDLAVSTFNLQNPSYRRALGLPDDDQGIVVTQVYADGSCDGVLQRGDVLLAIDDLPIASDASVEIDGERVEMAEVVERKFHGDKVRLKVLRDGEISERTATLKPAWQFLIQANIYDTPPRYFLAGGLLFQPLERNLIAANRLDDLRVRWHYENFVTSQIYTERPEIVILSNVLPDPINTYVTGFRGSIVDEINGVKITRLEDVATAFEKEPEFHVVKLFGTGRPIILEHAALADAEARIRERYRIPSRANLGNKP